MEKEILDEFVENAFQAIENNDCILILGPDVAVNGTSKTTNEMLKEYLQNKNKKISCFYPEDEFFSFPKQDDFATKNAIKKFYEQLPVSDITSKISTIPFHLIISLSPDKTLIKALNEGDFKPHFRFYNKVKGTEPLPKFTKENPLIYNLFGSYEFDESLVLTYNHLFEYLCAIFKEFKLPEEIRSALNCAKLILFVGFHFDKWYYKLILRLLDFHKLTRNHGSEKDRNIDLQLQNFCVEEFKIEFLPFSSEEIINSIYNKYKEKNKLRKKSEDIYISYAGGGESEELAVNIQKILNEQGLSALRYQTDLGFNESIPDFMEKLCHSKAPVVILSDKYLKSPYCMKELADMYKKGDFKSRVSAIILDDARIFEALELTYYIKYWKDKKTELEKEINDIGEEARKATIKDSAILDDILDFFSNGIINLRDKNSQTTNFHKNDDFKTLIDEVLKKLNNN